MPFTTTHLIDVRAVMHTTNALWELARALPGGPVDTDVLVMSLFTLAIALVRGGIPTQEDATAVLDHARRLYEQVGLETMPDDTLPRA
jgi:hypothetical protein